MSEWAIRVKDLRKQYPGRNGPVHAVQGIDLEIKHGECFGLLGPNGAGKTTTVEILEGLNSPTSGEVEDPGPGMGAPTRSPSANASASRSRKRVFPTRRRCTRSSRCFVAFTKAAWTPTT